MESGKRTKLVKSTNVVKRTNVDIAKLLGPENLETKVTDLKRKCSDILFTLLETGTHADFTFESKGGGSVKAHMNVLACASPVFFDMFKVKQEGEPRLTLVEMSVSMSHQALQLFLLLLYTRNENDAEEIPQLSSVVDKHLKELFEAAMKYNVESRLGSVLLPALRRHLAPQPEHYLSTST